jgi:hypothetical protein
LATCNRTLSRPKLAGSDTGIKPISTLPPRHRQRFIIAGHAVSQLGRGELAFCRQLARQRKQRAP